jgi:hypothetical protein
MRPLSQQVAERTLLVHINNILSVFETDILP